MKFFIKDFFSKCDQIRIFSGDLVTFTGETLNANSIFCAGTVKGLKHVSNHRKMLNFPKFSPKKMNPQFPVDLVTFTEEILNGRKTEEKFLCSDDNFETELT